MALLLGALALVLLGSFFNLYCESAMSGGRIDGSERSSEFRAVLLAEDIAVDDFSKRLQGCVATTNIIESCAGQCAHRRADIGLQFSSRTDYRRREEAGIEDTFGIYEELPWHSDISRGSSSIISLHKQENRVGTDLIGIGIPRCVKELDCVKQHVGAFNLLIRSQRGFVSLPLEVADKKQTSGQGRDCDSEPKGPPIGRRLFLFPCGLFFSWWGRKHPNHERVIARPAFRLGLLLLFLRHCWSCLAWEVGLVRHGDHRHRPPFPPPVGTSPLVYYCAACKSQTRRSHSQHILSLASADLSGNRRTMKHLLKFAVVLGVLFLPATAAHAQVSFGFSFGIAAPAPGGLSCSTPAGP